MEHFPKYAAWVFLLGASSWAFTQTKLPVDEVTNVAQTAKHFAYAPKSALIERRENGPTDAELNAPTQVVVLGTGTPIPDAYRAGSSIAIIHRGQAYLFDVGAGAVRRAVEARYKYDIPSLYPSHINTVFITHMHSDHVMDLSELAQTLWWRRTKKLRAYGPVGLKAMAKSMAKMLAADVKTRLNSVQPIANNQGFKVNATEIKPGIIFEAQGITVEAFAVPHGDIKPAFGYKIVTDDLSVLISGDTTNSDIIREKAAGVNLLFHEVISDKGIAKITEFWQNYHKAAHTLASDVGKIAAAAKPNKLILYHAINYGLEEGNVITEAAEYFNGEIILANDLDLFTAD